MSRFGGLGMRVVAVAAVAASAGVVVRSDGAPLATRPAVKRPAVDLQVALLSRDGCGQWAEQLPSLITVHDVRPGEISQIVGVCLRNIGKKTGAASLSVTDLVDVELTCAGDEATADSSCAPDAPGELSQHLRQGVDGTDCSGRRQPADPIWSAVPLADLQTAPMTVSTSLRSGDTRCLVLVVRYAAVDRGVAAVAQTDAVRWRYDFALTEI